jgi:hypothetical protein
MEQSFSAIFSNLVVIQLHSTIAHQYISMHFQGACSMPSFGERAVKGIRFFGL